MWSLAQGDYPTLTRAMSYSMRKAQECSLAQGDYPRLGASGVEDIDFLGVLNKEYVEIPGVS